MKFITAEEELYPSTDGVIYFYSSDQSYPAGEMMFPILLDLDKHNNIVCIDLFIFKKLYKRFNIEEIPTILVMAGGTEIKRITGIRSLKDINNILEKD
jgi:hypothetical protein